MTRHSRAAGRPADVATTADAVSVIIPVWNGAATLSALLESLERQTYDGPCEVVAADNGSSDGSRSLLSGWSRRIAGLRVVDASGRRGTCHARNAGARAARGWLLAFIDQDEEADPGWLRALVEASGSAPLLAGRYDVRRLNGPLALYWNIGRDPEDRPPQRLGFLPHAPGGSLAIEAEVLRRVGGWDERFRGGGEDVDLSWRVQLAGYPLRFVPGAIVHHRQRDRLPSLARQKFFYGMTRVRLYKRYRSLLPPQHRFGSFKSVVVIALNAGDLLRSPARRGRWIASAATRLGRLVGSVREGVFYP